MRSEVETAVLDPTFAARSAASRVIVSADAIAHNAALLRAHCATPVMAVVKADGFGLGARLVAEAALAGGAAELGVATCAEALALRADGITAPVMAWMLHPGAPLADALRADIAVSCASPEQLADVAAAARAVGVRATVELECETGMNRSGCPEPRWDDLVRSARRGEQEGVLVVRGVWTHLAATRADPAAFAAPLARLDAAFAQACAAGLRPTRRHAAASLAATSVPQTRLDIVRLGASLFGIEPVAALPLGLSPVARWESAVAQVREVDAGDAVGYGGAHRITRRGRLALLPLGYADGVPRAGSPGLSVSIGGRRHPLVGAVSMDQCVVDIGSAPVSLGDEVVLWGDERRGEPSLSEWALALDTIPQELLTGLGPRVARVAAPERDGTAAA